MELEELPPRRRSDTQDEGSLSLNPLSSSNPALDDLNLKAKILYDLLIAFEGTVHTKKGTENKPWATDAERLITIGKMYYDKFKNLLRHPLLFLGFVYFDPEFNVIGEGLDWIMKLSHDGQNLALLKENVLEFRNLTDSFSSPKVNYLMTIKDTNLSWRRMAWSPDDKLFAIVTDFTLIIIDRVGKEWYRIQLDEKKGVHVGVADIVFVNKNIRASNWEAELLLIDYNGNLTSYNLSHPFKDKWSHSHQFSFNCVHDLVVTVSYDAKREALIIGGIGKPETKPKHHTSSGITYWRLTASAPYYKKIEIQETLHLVSHVNTSLGERLCYYLPTYLRFYKLTQPELIVKMSLRKDAQELAVVNTHGSVTVFYLPSFRAKHHFESADLEKLFELQSTEDKTSKEKTESAFNKDKDSETPKDIVRDVEWWDDNSLVIISVTGKLIIFSLNNQENRLGINPEPFEAGCRVTPVFDNHFVVIECEESSLPIRLAWKEQIIGHDFNAEEKEKEIKNYEEASSKTQMARWLQWLEGREHSRRGVYKVTKNYRLVFFCQNSAMELYKRKIEVGQYADALRLAEEHNLDTDLLYMTRWREHADAEDAIELYMENIKDRKWVLTMCMQVSLGSIAGNRKLLKYGLGLITATKEDVATPNRIFEWTVRKQLLGYLDRLGTFELILEQTGYDTFMQKTNLDFFTNYSQFRDRDISKLCIDFSQIRLFDAVLILFQYHAEDFYGSVLDILSLIPETVDPLDYLDILPYCEENAEGVLQVSNWKVKNWREPDWVESDLKVLQAINGNVQQKKKKPLTVEEITNWYRSRSCEIDQLSGMVQNSLKLTELGVNKNVPGLRDLKCDISSLCYLLYDLSKSPFLTLQTFRKLDSVARVHLLFDDIVDEDNSKIEDSLRTTNQEKVNIKYLERFESCFRTFLEHFWYGSESNQVIRSEGMVDLVFAYIKSLSETRFDRVLLLFEQSELFNCLFKTESFGYMKNIFAGRKEETSIFTRSQVISLGIECVYAHIDKQEQKLINCFVETLFKMANSVRKEEENNEVFQDVVEKLLHLKRHVEAATITSDHGVVQLPSVFFTKNKTICKEGETEDTEELEERKRTGRNIVREMCRNALKAKPPYTRNKWRKLYKDLIIIQPILLLPLNFIQVQFADSLLGSSSIDNITLAREFMTLNPSQKMEAEGTSLSYEQSEKIIISSAVEYFNAAISNNDFSMKLAKECLGLLHSSSMAKSELALIAIVNAVHIFDVNWAPIQVRLSLDNKIKILDACLEAKPYNYQRLEELDRLCTLLQLHSDQTKLYIILYSRIVDCAIKMADYNFAYSTCKLIMKVEGKHKGWKACQGLAECVDFRQPLEKLELFSYVLSHCPSSMLSPLMENWKNLETDVLCSKLNFSSGANETEILEITDLRLDEERGSSEEIPDEISFPDEPAFPVPLSAYPFYNNEFAEINDKEKFNYPHETKKFHCIYESYYGKSISTSTPTLALPSLPSSLYLVWSLLKTMDNQSTLLYHLIDDNSANNIYIDNDNDTKIDASYQKNNDIISNNNNATDNINPLDEDDNENNVSSNVDVSLVSIDNVAGGDGGGVGTGLEIEESNSKGKTDVKYKIVENIFHQNVSAGDSSFVLSILLTCDYGTTERLLRSLTLTTGVILWALYVYGLIVYNLMNLKTSNRDSDTDNSDEVIDDDYNNEVQDLAPASIIPYLKDMLEDERIPDTIINEYALGWLGEHAKQQLMSTFTQKNIDYQRFADDESYREECIVSLISSEDHSTFTNCLSLCQRFKASPMTVYLQWGYVLFTDTNLKKQYVEENVHDLKMRLQQSQKLMVFSKRFRDKIWKFLDPFKYGVFSQLFHLLNSDLGIENIKVSTHQKIVQLIQSLNVFPILLNYKSLLNSKNHSLAFFDKYLSLQNIDVVRDILILLHTDGYDNNDHTKSLHSTDFVSSLYFEACSREIATSLSEKESTTKEKFELFQSAVQTIIDRFVARLNKNDKLQLLSCIFNQPKTFIFSAKDRLTLLKDFLIKFDSSPAAEEIEERLTFICGNQNSSTGTEKAVIFETALLSVEKGYNYLSNAVVDVDSSIDYFTEGLEQLSTYHGDHYGSCLMESLENLLNSNNSKEDDLDIRIRKVERIVCIALAIGSEKTKTIEETITAYCNDVRNDIDNRLNFLAILDKHGLHKVDSSMKLFYLVEAELKEHWPQITVTNDNVSDETSKRKFIHFLMDKLEISSSNFDDFDNFDNFDDNNEDEVDNNQDFDEDEKHALALAKLINIFQDDSQGELSFPEYYFLLMIKFANNSSYIDECINLRKNWNLEAKDDDTIFTNLLSHGSLGLNAAVHYALVTNQSPLVKQAINIVTNRKETRYQFSLYSPNVDGLPGTQLNTALAIEIFKCAELLSSMTQTNHFVTMVEYLLSPTNILKLDSSNKSLRDKLIVNVATVVGSLVLKNEFNTAFQIVSKYYRFPASLINLKTVITMTKTLFKDVERIHNRLQTLDNINSNDHNNNSNNSDRERSNSLDKEKDNYVLLFSLMDSETICFEAQSLL